MKHSGSRPVGERMLGNQLLGKVEIEFRDEHGSIIGGSRVVLLGELPIGGVLYPDCPASFPAFLRLWQHCIMTAYEIRHEIVRLGKSLHDKGFVAATDGNISVRLDERRVLATPTCLCKGMMTAEDLVVVDMQGRKLEGYREVSSEIGMHMMIYRKCPETSAIVHAHPPTATGFAAAGTALDQALVSEIVISLGSVPLAEYATPGTQELVDSLEPLVTEHQAVLMANHGVVTHAEDLFTAYMHMETVEHFAKIVLTTHILGRQQVLSPDRVKQLAEIRRRLQDAKLATLRKEVPE